MPSSFLPPSRGCGYLCSALSGSACCLQHVAKCPSCWLCSWPIVFFFFLKTKLSRLHPSSALCIDGRQDSKRTEQTVFHKLQSLVSLWKYFVVPEDKSLGTCFRKNCHIKILWFNNTCVLQILKL